MRRMDSEIRIVMDEKGVKRVDVVGHSGLQSEEIALLTKIMPEIPKLDDLIRGTKKRGRQVPAAVSADDLDSLSTDPNARPAGRDSVPAGTADRSGPQHEEVPRG